MTEALEQSAMPSDAPVPAADPVGPALVEMYLHPRRFVTEYVPKVRLGRWRALALLWLTGVATAMSVSSVERFLGHTSWSRYWAGASIIACIAGPVVIFAAMIGFDLRLQFCGVSTRSGPVFRIVLATSIATRLPMLIGVLAKSVVYASPQVVVPDARFVWLQLASLVALPLEYFAARSIFAAPRGRALFWFAFVPIVNTALVMVYPMIRDWLR